jgi:heme exporter protein D
MSEFFAMGGYAGYVWSAYGIGAVVLTAIVVLSRRAERAEFARLEQRVIGEQTNDAET